MKNAIVLLGLFLTASIAVAEPLVYEGTDGVGHGKHIVFIANDHEYRSEQSCPALAKILAKHHGFRCTVLFGVDSDGLIKPGAKEVPGMEALADADLLVFFTRFMNLPDAQADRLVDYFERGGPVVGIRTSTHCFNGQAGKWAKLNFNYTGDDYLGGLGEQVFGNTWHKERGQSHYGTNHKMGCLITPVEDVAGHPILAGVDAIHAYSGGYLSQPPPGSTPLLQLQVLNTFGPSDDFNKEKSIVSAGWTRDGYVAPSGTSKEARVVYTSFGASEDLLSEDGRRFLVNSCLWAAGFEGQIKPSMNVDLVGGFHPSPYTTGAFYYEGIRPQDLAGFDSDVMPSDASLGGLDDPKMKRKIESVLQNRPALKAKLEASAAPRWIPLFDGKTLDGWEKVGKDDSHWEVKDGVIAGSGTQSMLVCTEGPYKNFRYRVEVKINDGGNSGVYFRTTRKPGFMDGYEAQVDSTHKDPIRTGSLYGFNHVYKPLVKPGDWFTYEIEVRDDVWRKRDMTRIKVTVNGDELYEYLDFAKTYPAGHFAFQQHDPGSRVHIRKVEVMRLED